MADIPQDKAQIIQWNSLTNSVPVSEQMWFDGTHIRINISGTTYILDHPVTSSWSLSGVVANRTYNASAAGTSAIAQAVGTLIQDLQGSGIVG